MGEPRARRVRAPARPGARPGANPALPTLSARPGDGQRRRRAPTWCTRTPGTPNMAGHLGDAAATASRTCVTAHSLEPQRPWKAEQLGGGYRVSSWVERTAYEAADAVIAVSAGMRDDVLRRYPALDPAGCTSCATASTPRSTTPTRRRDAVLADTGVDLDRPDRRRSSAGSPGRRASGTWSPPPTSSTRTSQLVLCAGAPDTPEIAAETDDGGRRAAGGRAGRVLGARDAADRRRSAQVLSAATVFVCPSVYEPLGIVNLEAMACATAVVASRRRRHPRGGRRRQTGLLVHYDANAVGGVRAGLADAVNELVADPARARGDGRGGPGAGRAEFSWGRSPSRPWRSTDSLV